MRNSCAKYKNDLSAPTRGPAARRYQLISGDDKFMTRWIVSHKWKMAMQIAPECTLATTFKADGKFFMQILRWTRNTWRSDFKSLVLERDIWYRYPVQARPRYGLRLDGCSGGGCAEGCCVSDAAAILMRSRWTALGGRC
jgi:hypothetical protein